MSYLGQVMAPMSHCEVARAASATILDSLASCLYCTALGIRTVIAGNKDTSHASQGTAAHENKRIQVGCWLSGRARKLVPRI